MVDRTLSETEATTPLPAAFDSAVPTYDETFSQTILGRWLRDRVRKRLVTNYHAGNHVLELGCGTGEDAIWLAEQGIRITATDQSDGMLKITYEKIRRSNLAHMVQTNHLDLNRPDNIFETKFDGVFANFGVLNCVQNRTRLAKSLASRLHPGSPALFVVMNPYCPWETLWHLLYGQFKESIRRFAKNGLQVSIADGNTFQVWYPSPDQLKSEFQTHFEARHLEGLGVFLPPSYFNHLVSKHPSLFAKLARLEEKVASRFPWNRLNDHYILELRRR